MEDDGVSRRGFLTASASITTLLAGCAGEEGLGTSTTETTDSSSDSGKQNGDGASSTTQQQSDDAESNSKGSFAVRVIYDGEWQGSIATSGKSRSIQSDGKKTIDVSGTPDSISANAQKKAESSGKKLTVQILKDGEVVKESSTTADYGMAQTTWSSLDSGSDNNGDSKSPYAIRVQYEGEWQGSISAGGSSRSVEGSGTEKITIDGNPDVISANAQKKDEGAGKKLTIQILKNGEVVKEASTTAEFGMAQVSVSNF